MRNVAQNQCVCFAKLYSISWYELDGMFWFYVFLLLKLLMLVLLLLRRTLINFYRRNYSLRMCSWSVLCRLWCVLYFITEPKENKCKINICVAECNRAGVRVHCNRFVYSVQCTLCYTNGAGKNETFSSLIAVVSRHSSEHVNSKFRMWFISSIELISASIHTTYTLRSTHTQNWTISTAWAS